MTFEEEISIAVEEIRQKVKTGEIATVRTYEDFKQDGENDMTHYSDFYGMEQCMIDEAQEPTIVEQLGLPTDNEEKPRKHSEGKAEGARYCYLGQHTKMLGESGKQLEELETGFCQLVHLIDNGYEESALYLVEELLKELRDIDGNFLNNLIAVRAGALASGKYTVESYKESIDVDLLLDATARHFLKIIYVGNVDEESEVHHYGHIAANLIMIHTQIRIYGL